MARYLLIDHTNGRVLAQLAGPQQAARVLAQLARSPADPARLSVVRTDHQHSELTETTSLISVRPLPPLVTAPTATKRFPDRPSRHRPSTQPPPA